MSDDKPVLPTADPRGDLVASVPREHLRSMFYLFAGKPDSRLKVFTDPVHLKPQDLRELNDCILRKLRTHNIDASTSTVKVGYVGSELNEFGTWSEFENHHWHEPDRVEEVVIKWDFLVNIAEYAAPQRHTLLFRVSTEIKPGKIFQLLSSGNSDEFDNVDALACPAFCRVDFINAQISKELINEVSDWYKGRVSPRLIPSTYYWLKKRRQGIADLFFHWFQLSWALLLVASALLSSEKYFGNAVPTHIAGVALFLAVFSLQPMTYVARRAAGKVFESLKELEGSRVVFEFTSGDRRRIGELTSENAKQGQKFMFSAGWNIALNILASILYGVLFAKAA